MDQRTELDALLEDALKSQPLAPMPRSLTADVMARIQTDRRPALLTWSDFVLSFVIASSIGALWFSSQNLPPIWLAKIRIQGILLYQGFLVNAHWLLPMAMFGMAALLAMATVPSLIKMTARR